MKVTLVITLANTYPVHNALSKIEVLLTEMTSVVNLDFSGLLFRDSFNMIMIFRER